MSKLLVFATKGSGTNEESRIIELVSDSEYEVFSFNPRKKIISALELLLKIVRNTNYLVVMEGSGIGGGIPLIFSRLFFGTRYVVSSGDSIADFLSAKFPTGRALFTIYEFLLYRFSSGFIGWTPYLVGRALTMGAPKAMSAPGWTTLTFAEDKAKVRQEVRTQLKIPDNVVLAGIVGSLDWNERNQYCYGLELVEAILRSPEENFHAIIIGDGTGLKKLNDLVSSVAKERIHFIGRVEGEKLSRLLQSLDVAILPQSTDGVGSYRYTTKISEYLGAELPIIVNKIPLFFDLPNETFICLPGKNPWDKDFWNALALTLSSPDFLDKINKNCKSTFFTTLFSASRQRKSVDAFLSDIK
jgi:hypothetical protein